MHREPVGSNEHCKEWVGIVRWLLLAAHPAIKCFMTFLWKRASLERGSSASPLCLFWIQDDVMHAISICVTHYTVVTHNLYMMMHLDT